MSSSVFSEGTSIRPNGAGGDSNLVVVYTKNGISFDERAIENIMEEKSIASISVVRLTSPTPSMVDQEETERLEELERFLEVTTDREESDEDTDNDSQSGCDELISEKDHVTGDDNDNTGCENNDDSTETEAEVLKIKKRPGRKPKPKKVKKRRKPKERPQIVGLSVEQFYAENSADLVVKNALKLAGLSIFKRTAETDALLEIIRNDHNYTPFTSPEQMKAQKTSEKAAMERQTIQGRKFIVQTQSNIKMLSAKKRFQVVPLSQVQAQSQQLPKHQQQLPKQPHQQQIQSQRLPNQLPQMLRQQLPNQLQQPQAPKQQQIMLAGTRSVRTSSKVIRPAEDFVEDDEDANSSATADEENADTEELSEPSDTSRETDNDRDSDIDFKMNNSRNSSKRKRIKKFSRRSNTQSSRGQPQNISKVPQPLSQSPFPNLKRRKEQTESNLSAPAIGQIVQLNTKAPPSVIALGRGVYSTSFLKMRPTHKSLPTTSEVKRLGASAVGVKMRRTPIVQVGRVVSAPASGFVTPPQEVKEIVINKNLSSPKGVFTNLNSLLAENNNMTTLISSPDNSKQNLVSAPNTPKSSQNAQTTSAPASCKGFMPIGVETASSHKLPAHIVIETHQSSSELAAENDKQLDLIDSIVQDELLKTSLVEETPAAADENIPKLVKMLESSAAGLDQVPEPVMNSLNVPQQQNFDVNLVSNAANIDIGNERLLETPDEDEITADFLQHVVGLIEEDKQFEAEVVKQVLASTETGGLDAIANAVAPPIFEVNNQLPTIAQSLSNDFPTNVATSSLVNFPMACSTPARTSETLGFTSRSDMKIVRGNGRVIYLPPIEAPTTRAKRRAQNFPATTSTLSDVGTTSLTEVTLDASHLTSSSLDSDSLSSQIAGVPSKQLSRDSTDIVRRPRRSNKLNVSSEANDPDCSESQEDDDDPNKLWCICRQPHNNRFMICCDLCEDWYHGTCVSVTKAMGLEMEQKGIDWKCPKCVKKQEEKTQPRITDMLLPKPVMEPTECVTLARPPNETKTPTENQEITPKRCVPVASGVGPSLSPSTSNRFAKQQKRLWLTRPQLHQQQLHFIKLGGSSGTPTAEANCVVCKHAARANSVYCSDECIRRYAQTAIQAQAVPKTPEPVQPAATTQSPLGNTLEAKKNKKKDLFEDILRQADSLSKVERINVFERRSGRAMTGPLAPSAHQLKKWLQDNPTYEVVQPGSQQALEIEKRQNKRLPDHSPPEVPVTKSTTSLSLQKSSETVNRSIQLLPALPGTVKKDKPVIKATITVSRSPEKTITERSVNKSQPEPVRLNVRRTLKEQLLSRIKEAQAAEQPEEKSEWLTALEVENFVKRVESEMYQSFGRDVSAKYKSKYRSLMFNIKDRKNKTLFEKICAKQVEPKQLVRMTPAELASQELAKWREEEARHQLDMIKKSELDLLSCAQNYVVKTHKGEEVIESKMDVTLPDEESELEVNKEKSDSSDGKKVSQSLDTSTTTDGSGKELEHDRLPVVREKHSKSREKDRSRERDRDKRHKSHKHHNHQSASKRSRSRSSSPGRSQEKRSHKRHHHEHVLEKQKEQTTREKPLNKDHADKVQSPLHKKQNDKKIEPPLVAFNLIDQILESEKTVEEAANLTVSVKPTLKSLPVATKTSGKADVLTPNLDKYSRYIQSLPGPAIWTGNLNMVDVTDFDVVIHSVHGDTNQLDKLLPINFGVIGRITRDNVWDYLKKIKKSPTKEIVIVNLFPASVSNTAKFDNFFEYLDSRQRLGVLDAVSEHIRDFYIFPLATRDKVPTVLRTLESVPFYEDAQRPNTLLGIIVRCLTKRGANLNQSLPLPCPTASNKTVKMSSKTRVRTTFTPPSSPKRKPSTHSASSKDDEFDIDAIIKAPIAKLQKKNVSIEPMASIDDPNAPYSPGGSFDDNEILEISASHNNEDLERKVDEINKQIAAQRMEIAGLLNADASILDKPSSSSNVLANISIPPNLTKILASIREKSESNTRKTSNDDEEYNPEDAISLSSSYASKNAKGSTKTKSRLAQLSEAELLSMVPDNLVDLTPTKSTRHDEPPPPGV